MQERVRKSLTALTISALLKHASTRLRTLNFISSLASKEIFACVQFGNGPLFDNILQHYSSSAFDVEIMTVILHRKKGMKKPINNDV